MILSQIKQICWGAETGGSELQAQSLSTTTSGNLEAIQVLRFTVETGVAQGFAQPFL